MGSLWRFGKLNFAVIEAKMRHPMENRLVSLLFSDMKDGHPRIRSEEPPLFCRQGSPSPGHYQTMKKLVLSLVALAASSLLSVGQEKKPEAPAAPATPAPATPAPAGDTAKIKLGVIPGTMKFDKTELTCKAGQKVVILFQNAACPLQHNFLLLKPGTKDAVGALADKMLTDPEGLKKQYVPETDAILAKGSKLIGIGQSELIEFTAPAEAGDYPYICTFPGHWRLMNGVLKVTK
jgi:azurin